MSDPVSSSLFSPRSIAVVGASADRTRFGGRVLANLVAGGFAGSIHPVNPKHEEIAGLPCYPSIDQVPGEVDAAVLILPAAMVAGVLPACAAKGVKLAAVLSSGFAELGGEGAELQRELVEAARREGIRLLGPNGLGFLNVSEKIFATGTGVVDPEALHPGGISMVSQSGALALPTVFGRASDEGIGYRLIVASGNEADLSSAEVIDALAADPGTEVIVAVLEGVRDPAGFVAALRHAREQSKPVVVLKTGRSEGGRRAAASHTGSLAGSDAVHDAVLRDNGALRVTGLDELWEVPALLASERQRPPRGRRVAVVSSSGGLAGILADELLGAGLELASFSPQTESALRELLPDYANIANPLDVTGNFTGGPGEVDLYRDLLGLFESDPGVDIVLFGQVVISQHFVESILPAIRAGSICTAVLGAGGSRATAAPPPEERGAIHVFRSPEMCVRALALLCDHAVGARRAPRAATGPDLGTQLEAGGDHGAAGGEVMDAVETLHLLERHAIPVAGYGQASSPAEAAEAAERIGFPVVLKAVQPGLVHKTEAGAVALSLADREAVRAAAAEMLERLPGAYLLVQEMVGGVVEVLIGLHRDEQFGPVLVLGFGGQLVEILDDTVLMLPTTDRETILGALRGLRGATLFDGVRGGPPADLEALVDLVAAVSELATATAGEIDALDLNPVIVRQRGAGVSVVDAALIEREVIANVEPQEDPV